MRLNDLGGASNEAISALSSPFLAFLTAIVRSSYYGKKPWSKRFLEALLIGLATAGIIPIVMYFELSLTLTVFFAVFIGILGIEVITDLIQMYIERKTKTQINMKRR